MNYADAIVYLKENNITKEDGTFYEFGEVCSTYKENDQLSLFMLKMITYTTVTRWVQMWERGEGVF